MNMNIYTNCTLLEILDWKIAGNKIEPELVGEKLKRRKQANGRTRNRATHVRAVLLQRGLQLHFAVAFNQFNLI